MSSLRVDRIRRLDDRDGWVHTPRRARVLQAFMSNRARHGSRPATQTRIPREDAATHLKRTRLRNAVYISDAAALGRQPEGMFVFLYGVVATRQTARYNDSGPAAWSTDLAYSQLRISFDLRSGVTQHLVYERGVDFEVVDRSGVAIGIDADCFRVVEHRVESHSAVPQDVLAQLSSAAASQLEPRLTNARRLRVGSVALRHGARVEIYGYKTARLTQDDKASYRDPACRMHLQALQGEHSDAPVYAFAL